MPAAGAKPLPHRMDSFSGLRRSGSGAIGTGTFWICHPRFSRAKRLVNTSSNCAGNLRSKRKRGIQSAFRALRVRGGAVVEPRVGAVIGQQSLGSGISRPSRKHGSIAFTFAPHISPYRVLEHD